MKSKLAHLWRGDSEYKEYVVAQVMKTFAMRTHVAQLRIPYLVGLVVRVDHCSPLNRSVLSVGCRNGFELRVLHAAGFGPVTGIDLVQFEQLEPRILPMDMHELRFPDKTFDVVFACHSLEHAYDVDVVLREWARVTKPSGVWAIEVPVNFRTTSVDRHDFGSLEGLQARCSPYLLRMLHGEQSTDRTNGMVARLIGQVHE